MGGGSEACEKRRELLELFRHAWNQAVAARVLLRGTMGRPATAGLGAAHGGRTGSEGTEAGISGQVERAEAEKEEEECRSYSSDRITIMELEAVHEWLMTCTASSLLLLLPPLLTSAWRKKVWHWHRRAQLKRGSA